jgi:hypothetical protein
MTTDPTGTVGKSSSANPRDPALDDLSLAYRGGPGFTERLTQLGAARDAHDKAFAQLSLGKDVLAVRAAAQTKLNEASQTQAQASAMLAEATKIKADAEAYAADTRAEAKKVKEEALAFQTEVNRVLTDAGVQRDRHLQAAKAADAAKAAAEAQQIVLQTKLERLQAGLRAIA